MISALGFAKPTTKPWRAARHHEVRTGVALSASTRSCRCRIAWIPSQIR
jgi:hypothetical protein